MNFRCSSLGLLLTALAVSFAVSGDSLFAAETEEVLLEDSFAGKLGEGWSWINEDPAQWRIKEGKLQMLAIGGSNWRQNKNGKNYLIRKVPEVKDGDIAVEVFVENRPTQTYEHAGIEWHYDADNYVTFNKEQIKGKPILLFVAEKNGVPMFPASEVPYEGEGVWLRLRVRGRKITGQYRAKTTEDWKDAGSQELPINGAPHIGLHTGYAPKDLERWVSFSQFRVVRVK